MLLDSNPLPNTLIVTPSLAASTPDGTRRSRLRIAALPDVDAVQLDTEWVQRLNAMLDVVRRVIWLTGAPARPVRGAGGRQHHPARYLEPPCRDRGDEAGRRHRWLRPPALPLQWNLVWPGRRRGRRARGRVASAMLAKPLAHLAALYGSPFHLEGLRFGPAVAFWCCRSPLDGWAHGLLQRGTFVRSSPKSLFGEGFYRPELCSAGVL